MKLPCALRSLLLALGFWLVGAPQLVRAQAPVKGAEMVSSIPSPRVRVPTLPRIGYSRYPWRTNIVATVFWIGELPSGNNPTPNLSSSWDKDWAQNYGGFDDPDPAKRSDNYCPVGFKPGLNPFYIALPYNDCINYKTHKPEARHVIPWFRERYQRPGKTVLRGQWLAIRYGNRVCYAQWEDCGPFTTDDHEYVFGGARPQNSQNNGAGIDLSPAVRDYLGFASGSRCDWRFVDAGEVPDGPWRNWGENNPFVRARQLQKTQQASQDNTRLQELRRMRDEYFLRNGNTEFRTR